MFVVEDEAVRLTDGVERLCTVDLVGIDVVADEVTVFVKETSPVVLRET